MKKKVITIDKEGKQLIVWEIEGITSNRIDEWFGDYEALKRKGGELATLHNCRIIDKCLAMKQLDWGYN